MPPALLRVSGMAKRKRVSGLDLPQGCPFPAPAYRKICAFPAYLPLACATIATLQNPRFCRVLAHPGAKFGLFSRFNCKSGTSVSALIPNSRFSPGPGGRIGGPGVGRMGGAMDRGGETISGVLQGLHSSPGCGAFTLGYGGPGPVRPAFWVSNTSP